VLKGRQPTSTPITAPRGMWDFRRDGDRASRKTNQILLEMGREVNRSTERTVANGKRMQDAAQRNLSVEAAYKLGSEAARDIGRHAVAMERLEVPYREALSSMTRNYMDWFRGQAPGTDLSDWAKMLDEIAIISRGGVASISGYRDSVKGLRDQNTSQPMNMACDRLMQVLTRVVENIESTEKFCLESRAFLDEHGFKKVAN
jgi:hypothetical protein